MRGRFAWLGAAVVLLAVGGLATVGTQDTWLDGYGIIAYFLVPLAFIPLAAGAHREPAREPVRRERLHGARSNAATGWPRRSSCSSRSPRLLPRAGADAAGVRPPRRSAVPAREIPGLGARHPARERRRRHAGRRALHRAQHRRAGGDRRGRAARVRGPGPAAGADGRAGERRDAHRPPRAREPGGAAQERAGVHAGGGQHSRDDDAHVDQPAAS